MMNDNILRIDINLDLPPKERYSDLIKNFDVDFIKVKLEELYNVYCPQIYCLDSLLGFFINMKKSSVMYSDEISYWAEIFDVPFHKAMLMQLLYELNSGCTTSVSELDGKKVMIRTFDWPELFLTKLLYQGTFYKDNKPIYEAVCLLGSVGVFTGKSLTKKYSLAINYRRTCNQFLHKNLWNLVKMYWPVSYLLRDVLEGGKSIDDIVDSLETYPLISPVYFTVNRFEQDPILIVRDPTSFQRFDDKIVVQSNCDHYKIENCEELEDIEYSVDRYHQTKQILKRNNSLETVLKKIWKFPVIREDTLFISVISEDEFKTHIFQPKKKTASKKRVQKMYSLSQFREELNSYN